MISGIGYTPNAALPSIKDAPVKARAPVAPAGKEGNQGAGGVPDRAQPQSPRETERVQPGFDPQLELAARQRIEATQESDSSRFRRQRDVQELPLNSQRALASYNSNQAAGQGSTPTSELVGVDIFV